ncbi:hypothetical protein [Streptomyces sp. NPDC058045]|uniref:hypothetical protein n=1 Tax=Streptomyces sp. NPDC058045 TaxID=3346311 RepID=UPI0036EFB5D3
MDLVDDLLRVLYVFELLPVCGSVRVAGEDIEIRSLSGYHAFLDFDSTLDFEVNVIVPAVAYSFGKSELLDTACHSVRFAEA